MLTMSWDTQPTIKELPFTLEIMLWHLAGFHWRSGQWQHLSRQEKVDVSVMFHLTQRAHGSRAGHGAPLPPSHSTLAFWQRRASEARAATTIAVTSSTAPWVRKTVTAYLICQPIYRNIESCQKRQREHLLWFRVPAFYLGDARDAKSVNKQQSEEGI